MKISATILAKSTNPFMDATLTTGILEYPRIVHAELLTHRVLSKNSASSRAIPVDKVIEMVEQSPAMPVYWGANKAGMSADAEVQDVEAAKAAWLEAANAAVAEARKLQALGLHKQIVNRVLEPYQWMRVVLSGTEFNNLWALRDHKDADPTLAAIVREFRKAYDEFPATELREGEWHLPFVTAERDGDAQVFKSADGTTLALEEACKVSASCCAQVSYRKSDDSLDKALAVYDRLVGGKPVHASPFEHQALCTADYGHLGWTHMDRAAQIWSGNFRGFIQYRQMIDGNVVRG